MWSVSLTSRKFTLSALALCFSAAMSSCGVRMNLSALPGFETADAVSNYSIALVSGDAQTGMATFPLGNPFVVVVLDADGNPVTGITVDWAVTSGGGNLSSSSSASNGSGESSSTLTLGASAGANTVTATIHGTSTSITFSATASTLVTSTFNGWTHVKSVGPRVAGAISPDLAAANASTTIVWNAVTVSSGSVDSYNLYRSTSAGSETFATPIATGISSATRTYTDTTVVAGTTYYYNVAPVQSGYVLVPAAAADREIKVITPPNNMSLVHRWIANQEMCGLMGLAIDRTQNYRCAFTGIGGTGTHFDLLRSIFIDTYEQGVNITAGAGKCGTGQCITNANSAPAPGVAGDIGYSRRRTEPFYHNGTSWLDLASMNAAQIAASFSNQPGLPPAYVTQETADAICRSQTLSGFAGTKRLLRRKEFVAAAAWDSSLTDAQIDTIENGVNLDSTRHCNSNNASPQGATVTDISGTNPTLAFDDTAYPSATNRDTLPACLYSACDGTGGDGYRYLRTGSNATSNCVSRYGIQDLVGNVMEWNADQTQDAAGGDQQGKVSSLDSSDDLNGFAWDDVRGPKYANPPGNTATDFVPKIEFPHGFFLATVGFSAPGVVDWTATTAKFHGDGLMVNAGEGNLVKGVVSGGQYDWMARAGRYAVNLRSFPAATDQGFRCAFEAD